MNERMPPLLSINQLGRAVGTPPLVILQNVSFNVQAGETLAIVGASGSGKSTLLGLLAGLDSPSAGDIHWQGSALSSWDEDQRAAWRRQHVGFVFQNFQLMESLSALENVMLPLELAGQPHAAASARHWLERVGLEHRLSHRPSRLSGGEQQRVALARAFATTPTLVLADEPTANLDSHTGEAIIELMFQLNAEHQTTLILVTHDEHLAARCQRSIRLVAGSLQETTA